MKKITLFMSNRSQEAPLSKAVAMPGDVNRVDIVAIGRALIVTPTGETWDSWFDGDNVTKDFMADLEQSAD